MGRYAWSGVIVSMTLLTACASGTASRSAAENGYRSGFVEMVYAHLKPDTPGSVGPSLRRQWIEKPGVVFTNWTPQDGVVIGVGDKNAVADIEAQLRANSFVDTVSDGSPPTTPPTSGK